MAKRRRGAVARELHGLSLREKIREKAVKRELERIRQLLELEHEAYSDLYVMQRARRELQAMKEELGDDELSELEEDELLEGDDD